MASYATDMLLACACALLLAVRVYQRESGQC